MNQARDLTRKLSALFWALTGLALLGLGAGLTRQHLRGALSLGSGQLWGVLLLVLAAACGVALPILIRSLFNGRAVRRRRVDPRSFARYQLSLVVVPLLASFVAAAAVVFPIGRLHLYGSVLAAFYGLYGAYPTERKVAGEMRYYGLLDGGGPKARGRFREGE